MRAGAFRAVACCFYAAAWGGSPAPATRPVLSGRLGEVARLFDGKTLGGWVWVQKTPKAGEAAVGIGKVWSVREGVLRTTGRPTGYIRTEGSFENYVLTVEQRHVGKGNGGVLFGISGEDKVWPHSLEVQGANGEEGDIRNVAEFKMVMDQGRVEPKRLKRVGEWEVIEVTVDQGNIFVTVNGTVQNFAKVEGPFAGRMGLQAEGGEMEFRKVELRPIVR